MKKSAAAGFLAFTFLLSACAYPAPEASSALPKTIITVLHGQSSSDPGLEDMLTEKIARVFPNVELEWESVDWGDYFSSELRAKIASGEVPDIIIGKAQDVVGYQGTGYLAPFDDSYRDLIKPEGLPSVTVEGALYGIPYNALYQGVLYNKNLFFRYGLEAPKSPTEMDATIMRLQEMNVVPFASHFQEKWYASNLIMQFAVNSVFRQTPDWGEQFRAQKTSFQDSEAFAQCFTQVKTVLDHSWPDALMVTQNECIKRFANEEAAMFVTGTWSVQALRTIRPDMQIGFFPYPSAGDDTSLLFEPNITFMKNAQGEQMELVDQIIRAIVTDSELAATISAFTQTEPLVNGVTSKSLSMIQADIKRYQDENRVQDVTAGNNQLVWKFQELYTTRLYDWLEGNIELQDVLRFADENRQESAG